MMNRETTGVSERKTNMTTTLNQDKPGYFPLAGDLRECLGEAILLKIALDAVQSLDPSQLKAAEESGTRFRPQMMLTLLSYCYAARTYGSRDIVWAMRNDKTVRYICARTFPDWREIRQFRRNHRALIEQCLTCVLKKAWSMQSEEIAPEWAPGSYPCPDLKQQSMLEARNKIEIAVMMDMAEND
jgi:hypothetical protein